MIEWLAVTALASGVPQFSLSIVFTTSLVSALITVGLKELVAYMRSSCAAAEEHDNPIHRAPFTYEEMPVEPQFRVANTQLSSRLCELLDTTLGGVFVLGAPMGSGKSTYLAAAIKDFLVRTKKSVKYFRAGHSLSLNEVTENLQLPAYANIARSVPAGTVIVIDQLDMTTLDSATKACIVSLATESRNTRRYHVILCVSNASVVEDVLMLNGGEKVGSAVEASVFKWDDKQIRQLTSATLPNWNEVDIDKLTEMLAPSCSAGVAGSWANRLAACRYDGMAAVSGDTVTAMQAEVRRRTDDWEPFEQATCISWF